MKHLPPKDQILHIDLKGRDPDDGFTQVPYVKGMLFLKHLETVFGRDRFDPFLRSYFERFNFQSVVTADFLDYLKKNLLDTHPDLAGGVNVDEWVNKPGIPASAPRARSEAFERIDTEAKGWLDGKVRLEQLPVKSWSTQEWLHFLRALPQDLDRKRMSDLDSAFHLTGSANSEILDQWLLMAVRSKYEPAYRKLDEFLVEVGRRKYIKPLYQELAKTPEGKERARAIYKRARPGYHPISAATIDGILK
jgi:hypothetical protein